MRVLPSSLVFVDILGLELATVDLYNPGHRHIDNVD